MPDDDVTDEIEVIADPVDAQDVPLVFDLGDDDEVTVIIEGMEPDPVPDDLPTNTVRKMRETIKDRERQIRELKAKIPVAPVQAGKDDPEPQIEDFKWNETEHQAALREWMKRDLVREAERKAQEDAAVALQQSFDQKVVKHRETGKALAPDFDDAESVAKEVLSQNQTALIYHAIPNAAELIYALGRNPKLLAEVAAEKDLALFTVKVAELKGRIKLERKSPPPVESRVEGGGNPAPSNAVLEKLKAKAESSGDYTEYFEAKRRLQA